MMKETEEIRALNSQERGKLENQILPTARRWLRQYPDLAPHAAKTLAAWGQDIEDDYGRPYVGRMQ